jgi:hypothetical protein
MTGSYSIQAAHGGGCPCAGCQDANLRTAALYGYALGDEGAGRQATVGGGQQYQIGLSPEEYAQVIQALRASNANVPHAIYQATMGGYSIGVDPMTGQNVVVPANPLNPGQFEVSRSDPTQRRQLIIGFDSVDDVPSGATVSVPTTIQDVFRGNRFIVPGSFAPAFIVQDIRIGTKSQFSSAQGVPAEVFVPEALSPLRLDTAQVGQQISINVTNRSGGPQRFLAGMYGDAAR